MGARYWGHGIGGTVLGARYSWGRYITSPFWTKTPTKNNMAG